MDVNSRILQERVTLNFLIATSILSLLLLGSLINMVFVSSRKHKNLH